MSPQVSRQPCPKSCPIKPRRPHRLAAAAYCCMTPTSPSYSSLVGAHQSHRFGSMARQSTCAPQSRLLYRLSSVHLRRFFEAGSIASLGMLVFGLPRRLLCHFLVLLLLLLLLLLLRRRRPPPRRRLALESNVCASSL